MTLLLLLLASAAASSSTWDLADPGMPQRFFAASDVTATFTPPAPNSPLARVVWRATTPVPAVFGVSVLSFRRDYVWEYFFPDSAVPAMEHAVARRLDIDNMRHEEETRPPNPNMSFDRPVAIIGYRLFAFLPYGKGVLVSRNYALEVPYDASEWGGDTTSTANKSFPEDVPMAMYELDYSPWKSYEWGDEGDGRDEFTLPTLPAPHFLRWHVGESPLAFARGPAFDEASEGTVTTIINGDSMIEFRLEGIRDGGNAAAAFHYGFDSFPSDLTAGAFDESDGVSHHGLVLALRDEEPRGTISPLSLLEPLSDLGGPTPALLAGAVWLDEKLNVHYSAEQTALYSDSEIKNASRSGSAVEEEEDYRACPKDDVRNLALLSEGATILNVSSTASSDSGAVKAIDGLGNTAWSSAGDGSGAFITIRLPSPSNLAYVEFQTRTEGASSAQIFEYAVEAGDGRLIASSCVLPDALMSYNCSLDRGEDGSNANNVSAVTFRVVRSSGGDTGAIEIGVHGCPVAKQRPATPDAGTCASDDECVATVRSRYPATSTSGSGLCQCYAASISHPFDECEGESDATCRIAKCQDTCDGFEAYCRQGAKKCALRRRSVTPSAEPLTPLSDSPTSAPSPISKGGTLPLDNNNATRAPIATTVPVGVPVGTDESMNSNATATPISGEVNGSGQIPVENASSILFFSVSSAVSTLAVVFCMHFV